MFKNKKKIIKVICIISCIIVCIILLIFVIFKLSIKDVIEKRYKNDVDYFIDLNNDSKEEKIKLKLKGIPPSRLLDFSIKTKYFIAINDKDYEYKDSREVEGFYIMDINNDKIKEIIVRMDDNSISPSYSKLLIYNFKNEKLEFIKEIFLGELKYNCITKTLIVKKPIYESIKKYEYMFYIF